MSNNSYNQINKYLENKMDDLEKCRFEDSMQLNSDLADEVTDMNNVFDFLNQGSDIDMPEDFTKNLYTRINDEQRNVIKLNKVLAHSCIAAGFAFIIIDSTSVLNAVSQLSGFLLKLLG